MIRNDLIIILRAIKKPFLPGKGLNPKHYEKKLF
jgi:hypothetical protein